MGRPDPFQLRDEPEDLGGYRPLLGGSSRQDGWRDRFSDWLSENTNKIAKYVLIILALAAGIGFIADAIINITNHHKRVCY